MEKNFESRRSKVFFYVHPIWSTCYFFSLFFVYQSVDDVHDKSITTWRAKTFILSKQTTLVYQPTSLIFKVFFRKRNKKLIFILAADIPHEITKLYNLFVKPCIIRLLVNQITFEIFESPPFQCYTPKDPTVELAALNQTVYNLSLYFYSIACFD